MKKKKLFLKKYRLQLLIIFLTLCLGDIFLIEFVNDLIVLCLLGLSLLIVWLYHWSSSFLILWAMILLIPAALFLVFRTPLIAEKIALWSYLLLVIAIFMEVLVNMKNKWLVRRK